MLLMNLLKRFEHVVSVKAGSRRTMTGGRSAELLEGGTREIGMEMKVVRAGRASDCARTRKNAKNAEDRRIVARMSGQGKRVIGRQNVRFCNRWGKVRRNGGLLLRSTVTSNSLVWSRITETLRSGIHVTDPFSRGFFCSSEDKRYSQYFQRLCIAIYLHHNHNR